MTEYRQRSLQEIVNLIVALDGGENKAELDELPIKPWEMVDLLAPYADTGEVAVIRSRQVYTAEPLYAGTQQQLVLLSGNRIDTYPEGKVWSINCSGDSIVVPQHVFWRNLQDNIYLLPSDIGIADYVGWMYVVRFVNVKGQPSQDAYMVIESALRFATPDDAGLIGATPIV